ncbi:hypothetical protein [Endozoicomonas sp. ONNA2]|uniref:hypothetical protein n=1 Tax=Endozoicomonas sp. ONNA2 TaxID=2828741 RepID=UPI0021484C4E|nr:hypothetical protein [Endozoicomonas sp. ONNA2]
MNRGSHQTGLTLPDSTSQVSHFTGFLSIDSVKVLTDCPKSLLEEDYPVTANYQSAYPALELEDLMEGPFVDLPLLWSTEV